MKTRLKFANIHKGKFAIKKMRRISMTSDCGHNQPSFFIGWVTSSLGGLNYPWLGGVVSRRMCYCRSRRFFDFVVGSPCSSQGGSLYCRVIVFIVEWASLS